nr:hypothetical protein VITISV_016069 [Tanacetum cinerariifolium]
MGPHINIWNVTSDMKRSTPERVKRKTDTRVTYTVDALKHSETLCAITVALDMIHILLCDLELIPTKVANIEYIIFVDGGTEYCYLYLLESKNIDKLFYINKLRINLLSETRWFEVISEEIRRSFGIDDEVVQDQRQRGDNDLQDERQDQPKEEEVEPRRSKKARIEKSFGPDFVSFMIFKKKMKADGTIDKYKERLAIKGFRQQKGLYYFDTYSTRITPVKMIFAIAALRNGDVHQMDVKMIFLNGNLENILYMNQPEGFMAHGLESKVCRIVKSIYGLRKAPKQGH